MGRTSFTEAEKTLYPKHQTPVVLDQSPPVQNTWYPMITDVENVGIYMVIVEQENDENDDKNIEVEVTVDGEVYSGSKAAAHNSWYTSYIRYFTTQFIQITLWTNEVFNAGCRDVLRAHLGSVRVRMTSAVGTNQVLRCRVLYEKMLPIT